MRRPGRWKSIALLTSALAVGLGATTSPWLPEPANARVSHARTKVQAERPNILIIVADDLGFADVGFNGAPFATPNIDRIARMGTKLDHFYVSALCSPSRAGLLTGRYPHRYGIMGDTITPGSDFGLDPREETIAQVLARAGYARRAFLGKWHLGHRSPAFHPMSFGFTSFYGHYNGAIDYFTHGREGQTDWHRDRAPSADTGYSTDLLADEAVRILRTPSPSKAPWLMWLAFNAPHGPLQATEADLLKAGFDATKPRFGGAGGEGGREAADYGARGRGNTRRQTAIAMIQALDRGVGAVLDTLERTGQLDNTLILFTSDNGGPGQWGPGAGRDPAASNGPLRGFKFQHYEGGVRVAAAIAWPGHLRPRAAADVGAVSYVDLLPTIAHVAGAPLRRPVDGRDVSGALLSGRRLGERTLFVGEDYSKPAETGERGPTAPEALRGRAGAVIQGRWKLVGDQLFDLDADPYEKTDVASAHPDIVGRLSGEVARYAAMRAVPRQRMNDAHLPPIPRWELGSR